jgi:hypothetical protein
MGRTPIIKTLNGLVADQASAPMSS